MTEYCTTHIGEASYLISKGFEMIRVAPARPGTMFRHFVFAPEAGSIAPEYYQNATIPARDFYDAERSLVALLRITPR